MRNLVKDAFDRPVMALEHAEVVCRPCVFADSTLHWMMRRFKIRMSIDVFCCNWPIIRMRACPRWHGGEQKEVSEPKMEVKQTSMDLPIYKGRNHATRDTVSHNPLS